MRVSNQNEHLANSHTITNAVGNKNLIRIPITCSTILR
jgi:hypothetical protein